MRIDELEKTLLDQIEKLNDDSLAEDFDNARIMIEKSKVMSDLAGRVTELNRLKFDLYRKPTQTAEYMKNFWGLKINEKTMGTKTFRFS